jgi:very-short-patch-repair endonuclease
MTIEAQRDSPPPCGEGLGVGATAPTRIALSTRRIAVPTLPGVVRERPTPTPYPSPQGGGGLDARQLSPPPCGEGPGVGVRIVPTGIDQATRARARRLRRNMTDGERKLWCELREFRRWYGLHVRRQAPVGPYVADFVIHERKLVIEVDGEHHFTASGQIRDHRRDGWFAGQGYTVLRFNTGELADNFDGCIEHLLTMLGLMDASPTPSPRGGGEA